LKHEDLVSAFPSLPDAERMFGPHEWTALFAAFSDALEWALSRAGSLAREFPDEVAAVQRVRTFVRRRLEGDPAHVRSDDLLFTLGLIAGALQRDVMPHVRSTKPRRTAGHRSNRAPRPKSSGRRGGAVAVARARWVN
jgi:hypothetical protein